MKLSRDWNYWIASEACDFHGCKLLNGRLHIYPHTIRGPCPR